MVGNFLYAVACVVVPIGWGLLIVRVVGKVEKWVGKAPETDLSNTIAQDDRP